MFVAAFHFIINQHWTIELVGSFKNFAEFALYWSSAVKYVLASDRIDAVSRNSCKVLTALGNGEQPDYGILDDIDRGVQEARDLALNDEGRGDLHHAAKGALVYTLGQLADALRNLSDEMKGRQKSA
mgnify:CR=1 FL=1